MQIIHPLRNVDNQSFTPEDTLVIFGEVFQRGYANGLIEEAEKFGMNILFSTIGRRENNQLRPLTLEELKEKSYPVINVPLEAGFDLDQSSSGMTPVEMIKDCKLSDWQNFKLNWDDVLSAKNNGINRFRAQVKAYMLELEKQLKQKKGKVIFAHIMAGGVPRAKIIMPLMNRAFKGKGDRYLSSQLFWQSDLGRLCAENFQFVSAETFQIFIEESKPLRQKLVSEKRDSCFLAYGYHGTEIESENELFWQSYTPYLQGWAKLQLEKFALNATQESIKATVYNCPEILTNSSSIFQGVEIPLYTLIQSLKKEKKLDQTLAQKMQLLLNENIHFEDVLSICQSFYRDQDIRNSFDFQTWPQYSTEVQMNKMLECSDRLIDLHKDEKNLITSILSEVVFKSCGQAMLHDCLNSKYSTQWIGHDLVARLYSNG